MTDVLASSISPEQRYRMALQAGFDPQNAITAVAVSLAECANCSLSSVNSTGDLGLMQINKIHWPMFGGQSALVDPQLNMNAAYGVFKSQGWTGWCTYPGGCGNPDNPGTITADMWAKAQAAAKNVLGNQAPGIAPIPSSGGITDVVPRTQVGDTPSTGITAQAGSLIGALQTMIAGTIGPNLQKLGIKPDLSGLILLLASVFAILIGALIWRGDDVKSAARDIAGAAAFA